tara:strand:- start:18549 stop:19169 length:621 start_codon:yes stop_codon:yes gene_type:complete
MTKIILLILSNCIILTLSITTQTIINAKKDYLNNKIIFDKSYNTNSVCRSFDIRNGDINICKQSTPIGQKKRIKAIQLHEKQMWKKFLINKEKEKILMEEKFNKKEKEKEKILTENEKIINQEKDRYSNAEANYQKDIEILKNNIKNIKILNINDNDRPKMIKKAKHDYRNILKKYHPDKYMTNKKFHEKAIEWTTKINLYIPPRK